MVGVVIAIALIILAAVVSVAITMIRWGDTL